MAKAKKRSAAAKKGAATRKGNRQAAAKATVMGRNFGAMRKGLKQGSTKRGFKKKTATHGGGGG